MLLKPDSTGCCWKGQSERGLGILTKPHGAALLLTLVWETAGGELDLMPDPRTAGAELVL